MPQSFDDYHRWLGWDDDARLPNYYELFGLEPGLSDPQRIAQAADQAMSLVRGQRPGAFARSWAALLDELHEAKATLLDAPRRAAYDATLSIDAPEAAPPAVEHVPSSSGSSINPMYPPGMGGNPLETPDPLQIPETPVGEATASQAGARAGEQSSVPVATPAAGQPAIHRASVPRAALATPTTPQSPDSVPRAIPYLAGGTSHPEGSASGAGHPMAPSPAGAARPLGSLEGSAPAASSVSTGSAPEGLVTIGDDPALLAAEPEENGSSMRLVVWSCGIALILLLGAVIIFAMRDDGPTEVTGDAPLPQADEVPEPEPQPEPDPEPLPPEPDPRPEPEPEPEPDPEPEPEPVPEPEPEELAPPTQEPDPPTAASAEQLGEFLGQARAALSARDLPAATEALEQARQLPMIEAHRQKFQRLEMLAHYVSEFWLAYREALAQLQGGQDIATGNTFVAIVEVGPDYVIIRSFGRNRRFTHDDVPAGLARSIADTRLDESAASTRIIRGAIAAVDPDGSPQRAREYWLEAELIGADLEDLLPVLEDTYDDLPAELETAMQPDDRAVDGATSGAAN